MGNHDESRNRTLIQVTLPDAIAADRMFTMLMGEEVPPDVHLLSTMLYLLKTWIFKGVESHVLYKR